MVLWDFIETHLFPLFGSIPSDPINLGILGQFSVLQFLQFVFWAVLGGIIIHFLVYLPYRWILALMRVKRWRGK